MRTRAPRTRSARFTLAALRITLVVAVGQHDRTGGGPGGGRRVHLARGAGRHFGLRPNTRDGGLLADAVGTGLR